VNVCGLNGTVHRKDISWQTVKDCGDQLKLGEKYNFLVAEIDSNAEELRLSMRFPDQDPWRKCAPPRNGDIVELDIIANQGAEYLCRMQSGIEVLLPKVEVSWYEQPLSYQKDFVGTRQRAAIYEINIEERSIKCSIRKLEADPWPIIHKKYPMGTEFIGNVIEINPHFVRVQLEGTLTGKIPKESMVKAGFEYADFEKNLVRGQILEVVVTKVFLHKKYLRLDLKRNLPTKSN
jgi:ribosomal protein S1